MINLPELLDLSDFGGDFSKYIKAVYQVFKKDFIDSKPTFEGTKLALKQYPYTNGYCATFYHMTHEGADENNRTPDFRRMERIGYPRPMIDFSHDTDLLVWRNTRSGKGGKKDRILIFHPIEKFLVVLEDRKKYILPWTCYYLERDHQVDKKIKEYKKYHSI